MGASASVVLPLGKKIDIEGLPQRIDAVTAVAALGSELFDEETFLEAAGEDGTVAKNDFLAAVSFTSASDQDSGQPSHPVEQQNGARDGASISGDSSRPRAIWLCGDPGSGKTFLGDYLSTRGWHHIDGDQGNQSKDPSVLAKWGGLYKAMTLHQSGKVEEVEETHWHPYFELLVEQFKEALSVGRNVVLSFALFNLFGERAYLESEIPGLKFIVIDVSEDLRIERCLVRSTESLAQAGTSEEEVWKQDYMADYRKRYGEEYSPDAYRQMMVDGAKEQVYVNRENDDTSIASIKNDNFDDFSAIKALNDLVGLPWNDVDTVKIANVNMERMKNLNTGTDAFGDST
eukprot:INCI2734.1.p1 GENE.INCI2734.1~~INCI2734.1.p1  ORF type:complete len:345 (-),score=75.09 INCI2734.1:362-1396(-)